MASLLCHAGKPEKSSEKQGALMGAGIPPHPTVMGLAGQGGGWTQPSSVWGAGVSGPAFSVHSELQEGICNLPDSLRHPKLALLGAQLGHTSVALWYVHYFKTV